MTSHSIPWIPLQQLLQQLQNSLHLFSELLVQEETVMKRLDREKMLSLADRKAEILENIQVVERQIVAVLRPWVPSGSPDDCWLLIKQDPEFSSLGRLPVFKALQRDVARIREQGQKNAVLVRRGQYVVREALNLVFAGLGQGPVYQGSGALRVQPVPCSVNLRG